MIINDDYNIDEQWQQMKKLIDESHFDIYKFIGKKKNRSASVRARNNLNDIRKLCISLRDSILKQRQDTDSQYSK